MNTFFENNNFTFGSHSSDIKPCEIIISENNDLTQKLKNKVFIFNSPEQTNSSFYVITIPLSGENLFEVRRYIWNESKFDLYFIAEKSGTNLITSLYIAKTNPRDEQVKIASFTGNEEEELKKINKWSFNSGAFWLKYNDFLYTVKETTRVDKKLVEQLKQLKNKISNELKKELDAEITEIELDEIVQALIDRTLFIKFLEDNHIINSFFYNYHFKDRFEKDDDNFGYKRLLTDYDYTNINKLFDIINKLFNAVLFKNPDIKIKFLTDNVLDFIYQAIKQQNWETKQLSLFDFRFDVIPIEFISHIYEVFLEKNQVNEGIFYTPDKLAHLIVDETIKKLGSVIDPSCGSGMFLVLAFRKLLSFKPVKSNNVFDIIEHKNKIINDYIFGIELKNIAWRLSIFSLYLEILKDIKPTEIKKYIKQKLKTNSKDPIFPYDFSGNIIEQNALDTQKKAHNNKTFDYIVGNPPFFEITENNIKETKFLKEHRLNINNTEIKAKNIIGDNQISQAFMLKIKDWSKPKTRFGFIQNSSNFYNEKSDKFRNFFFTHYQTENLYELSRIKDILFRKATESVVVTIFNNKPKDNTINYYPVEMGVFSETFDLLIIQKDKKIKIRQKDILSKKIVLRDYLIGNEYDFKLINKLLNQNKLEEFLLKDKRLSFLGLSRISNAELSTKLNIPNETFNKMSSREKVDKHEEFALNNYLKEKQSSTHNIPYIYQPDNKIKAFIIKGEDGFMKITDVSKMNFQRPRNIFNYQGNKIIFNKFGKRIEAAYVSDDLIYSFLIFKIKLHNSNQYNLFTAILNSDLVNYYLTQKYRKRVDDNFANLDTTAIKNIPIPKEFDEDLVSEISEISKQLTLGKLQHEGKIKEKLNELIYDLYELNILEINRIKNFYKQKRKVEKLDLKNYKTALQQSIELFFENKPQIEYYPGENLPFGLVITTIYFDKARENNPTGKKMLQDKINEILETTNEKFLTMREKIYGKNCIYIVKNNSFHSWTTTKAFEDGQEILKKIKGIKN